VLLPVPSGRVRKEMFIEALWELERAKEVATDFLRRAMRALENGELQLAEWATARALEYIQRARTHAKTAAGVVELFAEVLSRVEEGR